MGLAQGLFERDYWREFAADPDERFQPPAWTENFAQEQLEDMRRQAYRAFYSRPGRLVRQLLLVRSLKEFWAKARVGARLLFPR
jgi:hypothetical protein